MKKNISLLIIIAFFVNNQFSYAQVFFSTDCSTIIPVTENCPSTYNAEIIVSGLAPLGTNNFGIVEAFFDIDQPNFFPAEVKLIAPNGSSYTLASAVEGINSFPNANTQILDVAFRECNNLPRHNDPGQNQRGLTFKPFEDFTEINDQGIDPNGTWQMSFCGFPDDFSVGCARLTFGNICPEVTEVQVIQAPSCADATDGVIQIIATEGTCMNYYYINGDFYNVNTDGIFNGIGAGPLSATVTDANNLISRSAVAICENTMMVDIVSGDDQAPVFTNCPAPFIDFVDDQCAYSVSITDPLITDNCGSFTANMNVVFTDGTSTDFGVVPGGTFSYSGFGAGTMVITYTATDGVNTSICSFDITILDDENPIWTNQFVNVTGQCGVDDPINLLLSVQSQLSGTDNCTGVSIIPTFNDIINDVCGASQEFVYEFKLTDDAGNDADEFAYVTVNLIDDTAPILSGVPANVTINCDDAFPTMPTVTAMDNCAGDITDQIVITDSSVAGSCDLNANAEIVTYTWSIDDGCNNSISVSWDITIFNDQAVDLGDDISACAGEAVTVSAGGLTGDYIWSTGATTSTITVTTPGTYSITVTGNSGCCSIDNIDISFGDNPVATATGGTLDCTGGDIMLMGASSIPNVSYSWTGPGGYTSSDQNPLVSQEGTYTLTVSTPEGCSDNADAVVDANTDVPNVSTQGDIIDCINTTATITGNSTTPGVTYSWTGPNGYTSSDPVNMVNVAGDYILTITAPNNCVAEGIAVVEQDADVPSITVDDDVLTCTNTSVTLNANSSDPNVTYAWTGPNGFTSSAANPIATAPGDYQCVISSPNGCTAQDVGTVSEDIDVPDLTASGGTINCTNTSAQLNASSNTSNINYNWSGPNGFSSTNANPTVMVEGEYTVSISSSNGCTNSETVTVIADIATPDLMAQGGDIGCNGDPIMINASSATTNVTYAWTGPDGFTSAQAAPTVGTAGMYTVVVSAPNGCTNTTMVTVTADASAPLASLNIGSVDCNNNNRVLGITASDPNYTYQWTRNNTSIGTTQNITISEAGTYRVIVSSASCAVTFEYIQEENIQALQTSIQSTEATSSMGGTAAIQILNSSLGVTIVWDNGQTGPNATNLSAGDHTVTVTNAFGCVFVYNFEILMSTSVLELEDILSWELYPTLTNGCVNLKAEFSTAKTFNIQIINMNGNVISNEDIGKTNSINKCIDFSDFADGIYMLSVQSEKGIKTTKIVKM
jgi:hypothetical protein